MIAKFIETRERHCNMLSVTGSLPRSRYVDSDEKGPMICIYYGIIGS